MRETLKTMIQVQTLKNEGLTNKAIGERLGIHRQTVGKYLGQMQQVRLQGREMDYTASHRVRPRLIDPYLEYIRRRLEAYPELTAKRLFREIRDMGFTGSKRTVRRYVAPLKARIPARVYKPYETEPGEQAQVDWGHETWEYNGQKTKIYCFVFVLSHSRMRYVEYVTSLDSVVFLNCLYRAFEYIGGVPKKILFDNAKVVVSERVGRVIRFQPDLLQFAALMQFQPEACWVEDPETKGKVESTVGYVHRDFYYGREFSDLDSVNQQVRQWCNEVNREVHTTTQAIPVERWALEKSKLTPVPRKRPVLFRVQRVKVDKASQFTFHQNKYSVPKEYARRYVRLEIYEQEFRVMADETEIGCWPRTTERGKQFLCPEHYEGRFKGAKQSALENQFRNLCNHASAYLQGLTEARGHSLREQMQQIVQLADEFTQDELDAAMERSLQFGSFGYGPLHRILMKLREAPDSLPKRMTASSQTAMVPLPHVGVETRDPSYYAKRLGGALWKTSSMG